LGAALVVAMLCALLAASAASASARAPRGFFGVTPQASLSVKDFDLMGDARVGTLRFELRWAGIDPSSAPGDYDWTGADYVIGQAARNRVTTLPFFYSTPDWVAKRDGTCRRDCGPFAPRNGAARKAWKEFVKAAVERYGRGGDFWAEHPEIPAEPVRAWQVWNEQNSPSFYKPRPDVKDYAKLLRAASQAITGVDRRAEIVLGGMFSTPRQGRKPAIAAWKYLNKLYRVKGSKTTFDGVAPHPYAAKFKGGNKTVLRQLDLFRRAMRRGGDGNADLWITEIGWASEKGGNPLNRGPRGQANRLEQAFKYFVRKRRKLNIENVTWYSWRDNLAADIGLCAWCPQSGLLEEDYDGKPSLRAFERFTGGR
jgi:polysaccharide biosynthesis protein PslG